MNKMIKRVLTSALALVTIITFAPAGGGLLDSVSAANVASGVEGTLGSVSIHGYDTMRQYIDNNFTYTDSMTEADYRTERSASYDRNDSSTGKNSTDYLVQAVEWTDQKNGEALLSVAGKDTTDSVALYVFSTCRAQPEFNGEVVRDNLIDLLHYYDRVDAICIDNWELWGPYSDYTSTSDSPWGSSGSRSSKLKGTVTKLKGSYSKTYTGICPMVSFYREDYTEFSHTGCQLSTDVTAFINNFEWGAGCHGINMYLPAIKAYLTGDISYATWNTANGVNVNLHASTTNIDGTTTTPAEYTSYLMELVKADWSPDNIQNLPTAVYLEMSDFADVGDGAALDNFSKYLDDKTFIDWLADMYWSQDKWLVLQSNASSLTGSASNVYLRPVLAAINPGYVSKNYASIKEHGTYTFDDNFKTNKAQQRYYYTTSFLTGGIKVPDKQLAFDIPIGDSWQVDYNTLPKANLLYTYKFRNTGEFATTGISGTTAVPLKATVTIDNNHVIHITTNTYVKGAEISIQIPLKYSADGVQSAKQLRVDSYGRAHTDGITGTPVADTYVISMTAGDTKLHVGPDVLGDLDTSLSIYMPPSDLMDVQVNLHWMNDSAKIKSMLNDTSVRTNATALVGSEAWVSGALGRQSEDDEQAGGFGTGVVAMNFADANGSVGSIASSYKDSQGHAKRVVNDSVDVELRTKNGTPDLWTVAADEADGGNVITYMMMNVPRFGHPTKNTYDSSGNVISVQDLVSGRVPRYYYIEDVVNVPAGYTAYDITNMASSQLEKLAKTTGSDTENPKTYGKTLYYNYVITPPSNWDSTSKATYVIDCYVGLDIKSIKMTVEHYQEQLTGDGYNPVTNKQYKLESSKESYEAITSVYSPEVKTFAGYDSPARQSVVVTVTGEHVIKYYYDLHYYDIDIDTQGGEWYEEQSDGTWISIPEPPKHYTILTPTFTLQRPDKVGYDFEGYTGTDEPNPNLDVTISKGSTGDKEFKANWIAQAYDVEVPVKLIYSAYWDGRMVGAFDQAGDGNITDTGYLLNNSKFPVQVTEVEYKNDSIYTMTAEQSDAQNIMNWRLDATRGNLIYNEWANVLQDGIDVSDEELYWMAQNSKGKITLDSDQAWFRNDVPDIKDLTQIGDIIWTFDIGHRNVSERSIQAATVQ